MRRQEREFFAQTSDITAIFINFEFRKEGKNFLNNHSYFISIGIINYKFMPPGQLAFYYINSVACLIIDIIAVKP